MTVVCSMWPTIDRYEWVVYIYFERSEFLIATSPPKKLCVCSTNLGFSVEKNVRVFD